MTSGRQPEADPVDDAFLDALLDDDVVDLYENAPCGYLSTLPDGTILKANETFLRMSGRTRDELVGRLRFEQLLTPGGRIYHETHFAPMLRMQGTVREIAVDLARPDGGRVPVFVNAALKTDDAGAPTVIRVAVFDATERREYERELMRARDAARDAELRARELAATLQASLIPPDPPTIPGLDVAAAYRPAGAGDEVGGDFYDVFELGRGDWAVVLGDVCGKGVEAATVTALARYTVRAAAARSRRPRTVLRLLNDALLRQGSTRFCTAVLTRFRVEPGRVRITVGTGGHWLPLRVGVDGVVTEIGKPGTVLGVVDEPVLDDVTVELHPGDAVVLFTDGVLEARRGNDMLGHDGLARVLADVAGEPAAEITGAVVDAAMTFKEGLPRDDIAVVVVRVPPSSTSAAD
jgi:sigma-B regulation protein RsbU (phosphoserine phosphatase)